MSRKSKVAIVDTGVASDWVHRDCVSMSYVFNQQTLTLDIEKAPNDFVGHGTAVADIIYQNNPNIEIISIRLCNADMEIDEEVLFETLLYIFDTNMDIDIINISAGITYVQNYYDLKMICNKLIEKGIIIVSAFDNDGAVSFPAAFDEVIGIDVVDDYQSKNDIIMVENGVVNINVPNIFYRTIWENQRTIIKGTSFATAKITAHLAEKLMKEPELANNISKLINMCANKIEKHPKTEKIDVFSYNIKKAIIFPVNKESHALLRYKELLDFDIVGVYDDRLSGNIGTTIFGEKVKSYESIDWNEDFDTVILSCVSELSRLTKIDYASEIIKRVKESKRHIYSFENINTYYKRYFYPEVTKKMINHKNLLKMNKVSRPVVCVMGTSSKQGKFSLQLELIIRLRKEGYNTGFVSSEPSGYLFGADYVYHFGYHSFLSVQPWESITVVNRIMFETQLKEKDIIITGGQSGTIHYNNSLVEHFGIYQYAFLLGAMPDCVILCINAHDDEQYLERTINFINAADEGKIIALVIYPIEVIETVSGVNFKKAYLTTEKIINLKEKLLRKYGYPVYSLENQNDLNKLCEQIINYFAEDD